MTNVLSKDRARYVANVVGCVVSAGTALFAAPHTPASAIVIAAGR